VKALQNGKKYVSVSYTYKRGSGVNPTGGKTITLEYKKAGGAWNALNLFGVDLDTSGVHTPFVALPCTDIHNSISLKGKVFFLRLTSDGDVLDTFTIDDCGNKTAFYQTIPSNSPQRSLGSGILDVFDSYNFTVYENDPYDKEVSIDPEMLGQIFEKLGAITSVSFDEWADAIETKNKTKEMEANKKLGVYYTPREIV
jgi:hypothetical protein